MTERILSSGARLVGSFETLPSDRKAELQRILDSEARRIHAAERAAYSPNNREPESQGGER